MSTTHQTKLINEFTHNFRRLAGCPISRDSRENTEVYENPYEKKFLGLDGEEWRMVIQFSLSTTLALFLAFWAISCDKAHAAEMPADFYIEDQRIVEAIYIAEGGAKAKKPFGILSVPCDSYQECRKVCLNTVRNNKKRYQDFGHKTHESFIEFLASRYAPIGVSNDPKGLNAYWIKNVRGSL